jgi:hypothetical protein
MPHLRKTIREAIAAALTGLPTSGARVFTSRDYPLAPNELPGLKINTGAEASRPLSAGYPRVMARELQVEVEAYAKANNDLDDTLDAMALEVEQAMAGNSFGGLAHEVTLATTELELDAEHETPHGLLRLTFTVTYCARENTPDVRE